MSHFSEVCTDVPEDFLKVIHRRAGRPDRSADYLGPDRRLEAASVAVPSIMSPTAATTRRSRFAPVKAMKLPNQPKNISRRVEARRAWEA